MSGKFYGNSFKCHKNVWKAWTKVESVKKQESFPFFLLHSNLALCEQKVQQDERLSPVTNLQILMAYFVFHKSSLAHEIVVFSNSY